MTYDSTLLQTIEQSSQAEKLPACLKRNRLSPDYVFPMTRAQLCLVATLCLLFAWTSFNRLNHTDLWGHLQFGRWIVTHGSLPAVDPFSAEPADAPMVPNAWLAQVIGYQTFAAYGLEGLAFGHALLATLGVGI